MIQRLQPRRSPPFCVLAALSPIAAFLPAAAAEPVPPAREIFAPYPQQYPVNAYRSASGAPGPMYWQNRADYRIRATLLTATRSLSGDETIRYTNNSPDALDALWVQLDQNIYRANARAATVSRYFGRQHTEGDVIEAVSVQEGGRDIPAAFVVSDTRMRVALSQPLAPHGGHIALHIRWHYAVPGPWGGRTAVTPTRNGDIWEIAQWFPRMAVYDDLRGWDTLPYLGNEFYLEYGDIDYRVTVPTNFIVAGSGALQNPDEVLSMVERQRLARAGRSDRTIMIRTADEVKADAAAAPPSTTRTWHFLMHDTRDVAFAASPAFVWDAAHMHLPDIGGQPRLAMSVYPVEAAQDGRWSRSTEYVRAAIEYFSGKWYPYPWPNAINMAGHGANMEYPAIVFDGIADAGKKLYWVTTHEIGHTWFPMIVGSNERRAAFMDEGFNTFIDTYASDDFNHGEYAPKRDSEYAPGGGNPVEEIVPLLRQPDAPTILDEADLVPYRWSHTVQYFKAALGLRLLREQILGPQRFDLAFRRYIALWAYRHPSPSDFFRTMDSEGGEDLSWFWRGWFANNWPLDFGVSSIDDKAGTVTLVSKGGLVMPATLRIDYADGSSRRMRLPAELWQQGSPVTVGVAGAARIVGVTIDPDHVLPDVDRSDNMLIRPIQPAATAPTPAEGH
ncbi:M1 family metallopeptidase [Lichenicoccus roseus]|uniref:M1 family metallopeptidase n=1 Tax=Lichenicoccus roseus TaxID=2683649 RepID=A0A5R9J325_9PROT|nr:M1 family metallopeptidase [Lichenicoccus roseus]TLU72024.1 M1 family metallopeptidase [Lichenicoccus roseus]